MNKIVKNILIVLAIVAGAVAAWAAYLFYGPKLAVEEVIPSGAMAFVRVANPQKHWHDLADSEFWKNISAIDVPKVLARNKISPDKIAQFKHVRGQILTFFSNPLTQRFLDREIAFALYPNKKPTDDYGFLLVLRLSPSMQAAELFNGLSQPWMNEGVEITKGQYQGQPIVHINIRKKNIALKYTRIRDLIVVTLEGQDTLNRAIDVYQHKALPLTQDKMFAVAKARAYAKADGFLYFNVQKLGDVLKSQPQDAALTQNLNFKSSAVSFLTGEKVAKYKFIVNFDENQEPSPLKPLISCTPPANTTVSFVPSDVLAYQWSGCYDFTQIWQQVHAQMPATKPSGRLTHRIEKRLHFKIEDDLLPILGKEAGMYLTDVDTLGMFPYPRVLAFVKVNNPDKAADLLGHMGRTSPLGMLLQEHYNKVDIHYLPLPLGPNMDPAYCFVGDYLLAATSRQLLKKSIDTYHDPMNSLKSNKSFDTLGLNNARQAHSITFLKVGELAKRMDDLLNWGNKYLSSQVSMAALYKQEGEQKKKDIAEGLATKEAELKLALEKLAGEKAKPMANLSADDQAVLAGSIQNLQEQADALKEDVQGYRSQQVQLEGILANYETRAESAKLFMFNSQQIFEPILKSLEMVNSQGIKVWVNNKALETELLLN